MSARINSCLQRNYNKRPDNPKRFRASRDVPLPSPIRKQIRRAVKAITRNRGVIKRVYDVNHIGGMHLLGASAACTRSLYSFLIGRKR